jgi:hypothetical protein
MSCETYREALTQAAASGTEPLGAASAHLDSCASCRNFFDEERSLFCAIDAGLRRPANQEVPASLLPRVRAQVMGESSPRFGGMFRWAAITALAVAVMTFALLRKNRQIEPRLTPSRPAVARIPNASAPSEPQENSSTPRIHSFAAVHRNAKPSFRPPATTAEDAQVLVAAGQAQAVALLIKDLRLGAIRGESLTAEGRDRTLHELKISPLEIAPLTVEPLDVEQGETR